MAATQGHAFLQAFRFSRASNVSLVILSIVSCYLAFQTALFYMLAYSISRSHLNIVKPSINNAWYRDSIGAKRFMATGTSSTDDDGDDDNDDT